VGQNDLVAVRLASYVGMIINFLCIFVIAVMFYLFPTFFLRLDMNIHDPNNLSLLNDSLALLSICGLLLIFDNFRIIGFGALRGLKVTQFPMYASFVSFWIIGLASSYLFAFHYRLDGAGIWWGLTFGIACGAVMVLLKLRSVLKHVDLQKLMVH
jgi:MATE family multidrug resistance protein